MVVGEGGGFEESVINVSIESISAFISGCELMELLIR